MMAATMIVMMAATMIVMMVVMVKVIIMAAATMIIMMVVVIIMTRKASRPRPVHLSDKFKVTLRGPKTRPRRCRNPSRKRALAGPYRGGHTGAATSVYGVTCGSAIVAMRPDCAAMRIACSHVQY